MKIAITGGAGFIGTRLAQKLVDDGHQIIILDVKQSEAFPQQSFIVDITDKDAVMQALKGADAIYHLAAEHRDDVSPLSKYYDVNVQGGQNVIDAARAHDIKHIIFTSSVAVYGLDAGDPETGSVETDQPDPFNDYGQSKYDSEKTFEAWAAEDPSRILVMMRLVATFGPGNRGNIYTLINQVHKNKFIMIGDGSNHKSVAYVGNVAAFLHTCLSFEPGVHIYNYADKPDLNMRDMVENIRGAMGKSGLGPKLPYALGLLGGGVFDIAAKITGKTFPISTIRVKKFCANTVVNADKVRADGFSAPYTLADGLKEMIEADFK